MTVRLLLGVALVANILVLVVCTAETSATSVSSASVTSPPSSSSASSKAVASSKPECRKRKRCPKDEKFSSCAQSIQRPQYCTEKDEPCSSYKSTSDRSRCKKACVCKKNFLRAENGTCIPAELCPPTCGVNEVLDSCPSDCPSNKCPTEEDTEAEVCLTPDVCPPPKCVCAFNYRRASNGSCVPTRECPPFPCKTNEEFNACPPLCPTDDCSQASPTGECPPQFGNILIILPCNPKCRCIKGYWRLDGVCVPYGQCPGVCPANERYSECIQGECRALECVEKDQAIICIRIDPQYCEKGCVCEEGYLRNGDGVCVKEDKCESSSCISANEEFVPCMQGVCRAKNCSEKGQDIPCPDIPPEECDSGCICKENFLRAANGTCVPEDSCDPNSCPVNEEPTNCTQAVCRAKGCYDRYLPIPCPKIPEESCEKGCICQWGYLRDVNNVCIPADQCPENSCPHNQRPTNCTQAKCVQKCFDEKMPEGCPVVAEENCTEGCVCQEGYLQAEDGYCVPEDQCESTKCPPFEQWVFCSNANCRAEHCYQKGLSLPCPGVSGCIPGCLCQGGYLRNESGVCIPEAECKVTEQKCPNPNEEWSACAQSTCRAQNCSEKGKPISCPMVTEGCEEACVCTENHLRNENGDCVPEDECEPQPTCGENEILEECPQTCNTDYCPKSADEEQQCTQMDPCVPTCKCRFNYRRAENGTCIPTTECPAFDCSAKDNEVYVACPPICPSDDCGKPRLTGRCPFRIGIVLECKPKCQCKDGYGRVNGTCLPFAECPNICPSNEVYSPCVQKTCRPQNCSDRDVAMETCPTSDSASCQRGCVCQENYYRNEKGVCVSSEECGEPQPTCGENEILEECPPSCNTDYCPKSADEEQQCTQMDPCVPTCKCRFNYRRAENGTCIPTTECPAFDCSAKDNEVYVACPPYCPSDECGGPRLTGRCPFRIGIILECKPKCQCKDGYGRVNGTCVPFAKCPDICPSNEVYSPCVQKTCRPQNCSDRDVPMETCPTIDLASCQRGCVCQPNFYRNEEGVCVSREECDGEAFCPNPHEVYMPRFVNCPPNICNALVARYNCTGSQTAEPACACEDGYLRLTETSPCIPICECPEMANSPDCK